MSDEQPSEPRPLRRRQKFIRQPDSDAAVGAVDNQARPIPGSSSGSSHSSHSSHSSRTSQAGSNYPARHLSPIHTPPYTATGISRPPEPSNAAGTPDRQDRSTLSALLAPFGSATTLDSFDKLLGPSLAHNQPPRYPRISHREPMIERHRYNPPTPPGSQGSSPSHSLSRVGYARRTPGSPGAKTDDDDEDLPYRISRTRSSSEGSESVDMPKLPERRAQSPDSETRSAQEPAWADPHMTRKPPWRGSRTPDATREHADADRSARTHTRPHIICPTTNLEELTRFAHWLTKNPGPRGPEQMKRHEEETEARLSRIPDWASKTKEDPEERAKLVYESAWVVVREFVESHVACVNDSRLYRDKTYPWTRLRCATLPKPEDVGVDWRYTSEQEYADRQYFYRMEFLNEEESLWENESNAKNICRQLVTLVGKNPPSNPDRPIIKNLLDDVAHLSAMLDDDQYDNEALAAAGLRVVKSSYELTCVSKSDSQRSTAPGISTVQTAPDDISTSLEGTEPPKIQIVIRQPTA